MTEKTRQSLLGIFLAGILVLTVAAVALFAAQRRSQAVALGPTIISRQLGFSIRMPKGWERVSLNTNLFGPGLAYMRKSDPRAARDIYFLITPPGSTPEEILNPLTILLRVLDLNDVYFDGYQIQWPEQATRPGKYQRRMGAITARIYRGSRLPYPVRLGLYEQITVDQQVFWCIIKGNSQLTAADEALLEAVVSSFEIIDDRTTAPQS